jgi:putative transport protein
VPVGVRAFEVREPPVVGHRVGELRKVHPLISIERILRGGRVLEARDDVVIQSGDTLALHGRLGRLLAAGPRIGPEVDAPQLEDLGATTVDVVVHGKEAVGHTILDVARGPGHGLFLNAMFRGGDQIPFGAETVLREGDVLRVTGSAWRIDLLEQHVGKVVRPSLATDVVTVAVALTLGGLIGLITIPLGSIRLTIGSAVGLLLVGIVLSTLRTRNPALGGPFPEPARQLLEDLGLNVFIAILGLNAGAGVLRAIGAGAVAPIVIGCLVIGFIPSIVAWFVGSAIMKMNDALLLGAIAGGRCNSAGMRAAQEATASNAPAISYPVTFAIANVIFTLMSYVMAVVG